MAKLWIALTFVLVALTAASGAQAYSTQPGYTVMDVAMTETQPVETAEVCMSRITPEFAQLLALPSDTQGGAPIQMACAEE